MVAISDSNTLSDAICSEYQLWLLCATELEKSPRAAELEKFSRAAELEKFSRAAEPEKFSRAAGSGSAAVVKKAEQPQSTEDASKTSAVYSRTVLGKRRDIIQLVVCTGATETNQGYWRVRFQSISAVSGDAVYSEPTISAYPARKETQK
ncbi:hypothetical protein METBISCDRAFT_27541 [Metschnikowia bicuspidata]|uniref:Uncharacterized protein n=1 Tax=Metschnikowia bicuspidata TaxID=27322 RepID=A0A4P9ZBV0_9ASCO|nr:hypothetical protein METBISCDRAFT_27541 [Metschnikowia bicuspidata]